MKKYLEKIRRFLDQHLWWLLDYGLPFLTGVLVTVLVFLLISMGKDQKLDRLEYILDRYFVEDVDKDKLLDGAAAGMVESLGDRWSYYMTAEEYEAQQAQRNSSYVGVGITITVLEDEQGFEIVELEPNGPASRAGMQVGDILIGADTLRVKTDGLDAVKNGVSGKEGTEVVLTVLRSEQELQITVKRETILVNVASGTMLENNVGLITIESFHSRCAEESVAAIEQLLDQGAESLIFDVRNNPGGYTGELIELLDYLLPEGPVFRTENSSGESHVDHSDADYLDMPMAVLVNGRSFSAAEFFAAALQEYEAAVIVGEKTTGKGRYQTVIELPGGSAVNLSVGRYFTPEGVDLTNVGVTPDVLIPVDQETGAKIYGGTLEPMEDPQILAAINGLKSGN